MKMPTFEPLRGDIMNIYTITYQHTDSEGTTFERYNVVSANSPQGSLDVFRYGLQLRLDNQYFNCDGLSKLKANGDVVVIGKSGEVYEIFHSFNISERELKSIYNTK